MTAFAIEKTRIPLGWVFVLLSCSGSALLIAVGVGIYAGRVEGQVSSAQSAITEIKGSQSSNDSVLRVIDERLSRIEGALGVHTGRSLTPGGERRK